MKDAENKSYGNRLDVVLKLAERCNLACPYCYYFFQENNPMARQALIDEKNIIAVKDFLKQAVLDFDIKTMIIGLHGGEPLLLPKKRFDKYMAILHELDEVIEVRLGLQTNGTLVDDEWIDLFEKHNVKVGVSIDGPQEIHDAGRPDHKGRGSYQDALRGLRLLQKAAKAKRIASTGILCVANPDYDGGEIIRHVVNEVGSNWFNLLFPRDGFTPEIEQNQERWIKYFDTVLRTWEEMLQERKGKVDDQDIVFISELSGPMASMLSEVHADRQDYMNSNRHFIVTISSEGDLGPDDNVMALDKRFCESGMNVKDHSLYDFFASDFWKEFNDAVSYVPEKCGSCEWYRTCRSGHLFNRYNQENGFKNPSVFCESIQHFHKRLFKAAVNSGADVDDIAKRLAMQPKHRVEDFYKTSVVV